MEEEIWKPVKDFENYEVSNLGNIRRKGFQQNLKPQMTKKKGGYYFVNLWKDNRGYCRLVHRLVGFAFLENPENKPTIDHIDNKKPLDNHIVNLRWATYREQNLNKGNYCKGTNTGEPNITYDRNHDRYRVQKQKNFIVYDKYFPTLEEAIDYRNELLQSL